MNMVKNPSKYFLNLETRNIAKSHIRKIVIDDNLNETTDPGEIFSYLRNFTHPCIKGKVIKLGMNALNTLKT